MESMHLSIHQEKTGRQIKYAFKHRKLVNGHRCTYKRQWNEDRINAAVEGIIRKFVKNSKFAREIRKQIGSSMDTSELDREYDGLKDMCIYVEHCDGTSAAILKLKRKDSERGLFFYQKNKK